MRGLVTKTLGGFFFVADSERNIYKTRIRGRIRQSVYPGDRVEFCPEKSLLEGIRPRKTLLKRPKIANVDQVLIVQSCRQPDFDSRLLDRFLLLVEERELNPLIVVNKIDLVSGNQYRQKLLPYLEIGYDVFFTSAREKKGLSHLAGYLEHNLNVLAGPSGSGKSSLINQLLPGANLRTRKVSKKLDRGVHTTRKVELIPYNNQGWVADSPGFTSLSIDHIKPEELPFYFPEFLDYFNDCKFNTCSHTHEPQCAVKDAVEAGEISSTRYRSYKMMYRELTS